MQKIGNGSSKRLSWARQSKALLLSSGQAQAGSAINSENKNVTGTFFRFPTRALSIVAVVLSATCSVNAQTQQQISWCEGGSAVTPDQRLSGCTAVIESGSYQGDRLSNAFSNRGLAYSANGESDRAIQDYDQSIRLNPKNAATFNNRGNVYLNKHQPDLAIQDYDQAVRLDPKYADAFNNRGLAYAQKIGRAHV